MMRNLLLAAANLVPLFLVVQGAFADGPDVTMTWVEKYVTYRQRESGELELTDVHFLAEISFDGERDFDTIRASLFKDGSEVPLATFAGSDKRAFTNGYYYTRKTRSFDSVEDLEAVHPSDAEFTWHVSGPAGDYELPPIRIGGPEGSLQVPPPSPIHLLQNGAPLRGPLTIDSGADLTIAWNPFDIGATLEGTEWDDLIFVLISDCTGEVVYTAGAPGTDVDFARFDDESSLVPAGTLQPGRDYVIFISQVNYVDHNASNGIEQLAANSFATELAIRTVQESSDSQTVCEGTQRPAQYLWTRKTRGEAMQTWPTVADYW
ncbi:MAG: hypothetical protein R3315_13785 [Woeseiaceae bacterium]|nr:hypothetical protein [Woeseiaceae bacterium]